MVSHNNQKKVEKLFRTVDHSVPHLALDVFPLSWQDVGCFKLSQTFLDGPDIHQTEEEEKKDDERCVFLQRNEPEGIRATINMNSLLSKK